MKHEHFSQLPRVPSRCVRAGFLLILLVALVLLGVSAPVAQAAGFTVPCGNVAALRQAITNANANTVADTITLAANCTYTLNNGPYNFGNGPNGLPIVTSEITIIGNGSKIVRAAQAPAFRILQIGAGVSPVAPTRVALGSSGQLTLKKVTISGGLTPAAEGDLGHSYDGGGIYVGTGGTLVLMNSTVSKNATGDAVGSYYAFGGRGGGIFATSYTTLSLASSTVSGNSTGSGSSSGQATYPYGIGGDGGGIYVNSNAILTLTNSVVNGNSTGNGNAQGTWGYGSGGNGGGIFIGGRGEDGPILAGVVSAHTLTNSTVSSNRAGDGVGSEYGQGGTGGGIFSYDELALVASTVSGNLAGNGSGNSYGVAGDAGGIAAFDILELTNSTVSDNSAGTGIGGNASYGGVGGGIYTGGGRGLPTWQGLSAGSAPVQLRNRIEQSRAASAPVPGGVTLVHSTIAGNGASEGGGIYLDYNLLTAQNTIIAKNTADDCALNKGFVTDNGYNLDSDGSCKWLDPTSLSSTDPLFDGTLRNNGGPTMTMALSTSSPARDIVPVAACPVSTDQRGVARPQPMGGNCDIGAYEFAMTGDGSARQIATVLSNGSLILYTVTVQNAGTGVAQGVVLQDSLDPVTKLVWATTTQGTCAGVTTVKCAIGNVPVGRVVTVKILVKVLQSVPAVTNTIYLTGTGDPNLSNNTSSVTVPLGGNP